MGNGFVENFVSQDRTELLRKVTHLCFNESGNLGYRKIFLHKKRMSLLSVDFCLSADKIREGTLLCFERFLVSKRLMHKKGISLFSFEYFLSHLVVKIRRGAFLCFKKSSGIENFHAEEGGGHG